MHHPRSLARLMLLALLSIATAWSQASAGGGSIQGNVTDSSGAAVPRAKIEIVQVETGRNTKTEANGEGFFSTPSLSIGSYTVRIEAPGMKTWQSELVLEAGRTAEIRASLTPGSVTETVTVEASAPLVTTTDPTEGSTLESKRIAELPVNGRDLNTLLGNVVPGVEQNIDVNGGIRTSGLMTYSTDYIQDGASSNNREFGGSMNLQGLESIGEVRVETSTSSAKYNRPTSVIVTTKGGTNQIRGSLYETIRNNAFGVARARQDVNPSGAPYQLPKLIRNEFGGSIGGPVVLPSFGLNGKKFYNGRNRTFFFFSREGVEMVQGLTRDVTVPTAAMRNGDFSGLIDAQGRKITIYDPLTTRNITLANGRVVSTRDPFPNNMIDPQRQSPLSKFVWGNTPLPNDITNPLVTTNLRLATPTVANPNVSDNPATVRLDHRFTDKDNFFIKFNGGQRATSYVNNATVAPMSNQAANLSFLYFEALAGAASWTHIFSPQFFVETLVNRTSQTSRTVTGPNDVDWSTQLGLPNPLGAIGWPNVQNVAFMNYLEVDTRRGLRSMVSNAAQNYSLIRKTHDIQFGFAVHEEIQKLLPDQGAISGSSTFNSLATAVESQTTGTATAPAVQTLTGNDAANLFLGYANTYSVSLTRGLMRLTDRNYGLYIQDNWKATPRLSLNGGLRWDMNPAFSEAHNLLNTFDLKTHSIVLPESLDYYYKLGATTPQVVSTFQKVGVKFASAQDVGLPKQFVPSNMHDMGPRIGFAYRALDGARQFVIRGGYGVYYSPVPMRTLLAQLSLMPPFRATYSYSPNGSPFTFGDGIPNYLLRTVPTIVAGKNSANVIALDNPNAVGRGVAVNALAPEQPNLMIQEWNLSLEREFGKSTVVRVRYNGKHGIHADQTYEYNPQAPDYVWYASTLSPIPTGEFAGVARRPFDQAAYTTVRVFGKTGYINTTLMSLEVERRFSKGLGFQAFYTITNSLRAAGNSTRDGLLNDVSAYLPGAVPTDVDVRNRLLNYSRDTGVPQHRIRWNWDFQIPVGRGRHFAAGANKWVDAAIGGWKLSGTGTIVSSWYALPANNWGAFTNFEVYGKKYPILDCRNTPTTATSAKDERCIPGYLWFNGYISQRNINSRNAAGLRNGVFGLPADYHPAETPVIPWPKGGQTTDPGAGDYDTNITVIRLANGTQQRVTVDTGLHPWRNQYALGPMNWNLDSSLLKAFPIKERARLWMSLDVFNVFNNQGLNVPGTDGIVSLQNSYGGFGFRPRQMQLKARLEW